MGVVHTLALVIALALPAVSWGQQVNTGGGVVGGVGISTEGFLQYRQIGATAPAGGAAGNRKADQLYVSLPRALAEWRTAKDAGKDVPADVRYLKGLTQIQDIFIYPAEHDIVLAGPAEAYKADNPLEPLGAVSRRPVVQLEDLIVALRAVQGNGPRAGRGGNAGTPGGRDFYGCSLENPANFQQAWTATLARFGTGPRDVLQAEMKKALGPQEVKLYGVPGDSRIAMTMVAADYRLKRLSMGLESVAGLGNALGSETSAPRIWFEPAYEPLLMTADGNAYEFRGPRLKVLVAQQQFNPQGATDGQKRYGENFSRKVTDVAARIDAIADLQNVTDCFMTAALIRQDRLVEKVGLDLQWLLAQPGAGPYQTASLPVPKTADTVVHIQGNVIAQGGVSFAMNNFTGVERNKDGKVAFAATASRPKENWFVTVTR